MSLFRVFIVLMVSLFMTSFAFASKKPASVPLPSSTWLLTVRGNANQIDFVFFTDAFATGFAALDPGFIYPTKAECHEAGRSVVSSVLSFPAFEGNTYTINCALINPKDSIIVGKDGIIKK